MKGNFWFYAERGLVALVILIGVVMVTVGIWTDMRWVLTGIVLGVVGVVYAVVREATSY